MVVNLAVKCLPGHIDQVAPQGLTHIGSPPRDDAPRILDEECIPPNYIYTNVKIEKVIEQEISRKYHRRTA